MMWDVHAIIQNFVRLGMLIINSIFSLILLSGIIFTAMYFYWSLPIHQVSVRCYDFTVAFEGPKNNAYLKEISKRIRKWGEPVIVEDNRVYSTNEGVSLDQMREFIMYYVRPEWFRDPPSFENSQTEQIVNVWLENRIYSNVSNAYCHFLEAAISKDGVDVKARRNNPHVWPPEKVSTNLPYPNK